MASRKWWSGLHNTEQRRRENTSKVAFFLSNNIVKSNFFFLLLYFPFDVFDVSFKLPSSLFWRFLCMYILANYFLSPMAALLNLMCKKTFLKPVSDYTPLCVCFFPPIIYWTAILKAPNICSVILIKNILFCFFFSTFVRYIYTLTDVEFSFFVYIINIETRFMSSL